MATKTCTDCGGSGYHSMRGVNPGSQGSNPAINCRTCGGKGWVHDNDKPKAGCFITTATILSLGKPDDCAELNAFRNFRDNWLAQQPDGVQIIETYYRIAPKIVSEIDRRPERKIIYQRMWEESISPCLDLIRNERYLAALSLYSELVSDLEKEHLQG